ncbi:hypothetical protein GC173_03850 [bacterium]|nr:hypothetical protein [bacterium]
MSTESRQNIKQSLDAYANAFEVVIQTAADDISTKTDRKEVLRTATLWKVRAVEHNRQALANTNPVAALVDAWALAYRMEAQMQGDEGARLFGAQRPIAEAACTQLRLRLDSLAVDSFGEDTADRLRQTVSARAREHPIVGVFESVPTTGIGAQSTELISSVIALPLAPLRTFGKVNRTADSIREFNQIADRMADIIEDTPRETRWQLELLAQRLEDNDTVTSLVLALDRTSQEVVMLRAMLEDTPELSRGITRAAFEEATRALPEVQSVLAEARGLVRDADGLTSATAQRIERVQLALVEAQQAAERLRLLSESMNTTMQTADRLAVRLGVGEQRPETPGARPFDIREYEAAARSLEAAAKELNNLLERSEAVLASDAVDATEERALRVARETSSLFEQAVNRAIWRIFIAAIAVVLLALGGQWLLSRRKS